MKHILPAALLMLLLGGTSVAAPAEDFSGRWEISAKAFGQTDYFLPIHDGRLVIARKGGRYSGAYDRPSFAGDLRSDGLHLACTDRSAACGTLLLHVAKGNLSGDGTIGGLPVTIGGKRPVVRPADVPRLHDFRPREFHSLFSGTIPPVLHIFPGDSVRTETVDNRGHDGRNVARSPRGNPQTGPFYIEGAMSGDTLVVHLDRVRTNRDTAFQTNSVWADALESDYRASAPQPPDGSAVWKLDAAAGMASLARPGDKLKDFVVRMEPMLGCIAVAPPRGQAWATSHLGPFGGNMDSREVREVREGATIYLPVFQPGALLYLGDAHAEQGDGELTGQGLETSMDVQFTVEVIEGKSLGQPWVEDKDDIMVMGVGASLDAALKSATTGMSRWLADHYKLDGAEIAAVLGSTMQFEVAEVVDPEFNVVAKLRKDALNRIGK